jgi:hypothetical protein
VASATAGPLSLDDFTAEDIAALETTRAQDAAKEFDSE